VGLVLILRGECSFKDTKEKEVLIWKHIQSETVKEYKALKQQLEISLNQLHLMVKEA